MPTFLLALAALASGWLLARRVLRERDPLLAGALAPLLGAAVVLIGANAGLQDLALAGVTAIPAALLAFVKGPTLESPRLCRGGQWAVGLSAATVALYTWYAQMRFLDTDNWIHEPLITSYRLGLLPPRNPFFPELTLNGHYGRDLLVAAFTPAGADPLGTVWALNLVLQVAAFLALFGSIRAITGHLLPGFLAAVLMFFGADVGIRVGLVDTFDGNNGVVYALLALNLHLLFRLFQPAPAEAPPGDPAPTGDPAPSAEPASSGDAAPAGEAPQPPNAAGTPPPVPLRLLVPAWILSGAVLGIYQVVYETHFGLLLLTGATLGLVFRDRRAWAGLLVAAAVALPMAATEGGPLTDLARRQGRTEEARVVQNQGQHVSLRFPKDHLFQVLATDSIYQRTSVAYRTRLFGGLYRPPQGSGYMSIFDPRFLTTHWLPLYLAPLTLWSLWRRRSLVGLGLWAFGAWAYLVPGLVDFGPIYEWEYFRWEFAAGVAFAGALGIALAGWLKPDGEPRVQLARVEDGWALRVRRGALPVALAGLVLVACLAAGQKLLNDAIIDVQGKHPALLAAPGRWRTLQPELGFSEADVHAARWLRERVVPGERFLSNRSDDTPQGIWPDAVFSTISGALPAGHAFPPGSEGTHAAPPSYVDALSRAFWATGRVELLAPTGVRWLYADLGKAGAEREKQLQAAPELRAGPVFEDGAGQRRQVFEVLPRAAGATSGELVLQATLPAAGGLRVGERHDVQVTVRNAGSEPASVGAVQARILDSKGEPTRETPLQVDFGLALRAGESGTAIHSLVTPLDEGEYQYELTAGESLLRLPFRVDFLTRLGTLQPRLDLPDGFLPRHFYRMRLGLTSRTPLQTGDEVELSYRLRREGGEYVWELDSIPQPLELDLQPGFEQETFFQLLTPEPGAYDLELVLKDLRTGRTVPVGKPVRVAVGAP